MIGLYVPGTSVVHRAPPGLKLALLAAFVLVLGIWRTPAVVAAGLAVVVAVTALARLGARPVIAQVRPVLLVVAVVAAAQVWLADARTAAVVAGSLLLAVAGAGLVTLTTRTQDLLDAVVVVLRPLRRVGVDPDRVGLVLALTVRTVPVLAGLAAEVRDARRARGAERSVRAFAVPLVIRAVRHADRLGEALAARGVDD
jgi:biotin transport system permease protein